MGQGQAAYIDGIGTEIGVSEAVYTSTIIVVVWMGMMWVVCTCVVLVGIFGMRVSEVVRAIFYGGVIRTFVCITIFMVVGMGADLVVCIDIFAIHR